MLLCIYHLHILITILKDSKSCRTFHSKRMNSDIIRCKFFYDLHSFSHIVYCLLRQSHDKIHIYIVKACFSCKLKAVYRILYRMVSSDYIKCLLLHRLRIYRNTAYSVCFKCLKLITCYRIRSSGFHCKLQTI